MSDKNDRQNPITGQVAWTAIVNESHVIEYMNDAKTWGFRLNEYPQSGSLSVIADGSAMTVIGSGNPKAGQCRPDVRTKSGFVWCHEDDVGKTALCTYSGGGTTFRYEVIEETVNDAVPAAVASEVPGAVDSYLSGNYEFLNNAVTVYDQKSQNTAGGTFTSGARRTRDLNTLDDPGSYGFASLGSNRITLDAGRYLFIASAPAYRVDRHQTWLRNITDSTDELIGTSELAYSVELNQTVSHIAGVVEISAQKSFEIQHQCETTQATNGMGNEANMDSEIYTRVIIVRLK